MKRIALVLCALLAFTLSSCGNKNTPENAVENFYKASQANEQEKALEYTNLSEEDRQHVLEFVDQMGMVIHEYKVLNSTIDEFDSNYATVTLHLVSSNAFNPDTISNDIEVPCVKVNGEWKVNFL